MSVIPFCTLALTAGLLPLGQGPVEPAALVTRMQSAYRSLESYRHTGVWTRKVGEREIKAETTLAMKKPNRYLFEMTGGRLGTVVVSDGTALTAYRPERKAYTRAAAPPRIIGANLLQRVEQPSLAARLVTLLLQANIRDGDPQIAQALARAAVTGPQEEGGRLLYQLSLPLSNELEARVSVSSNDYLIRRVSLFSDGALQSTEFAEANANAQIADGLFRVSLPEDARLVASLPPLPDLATQAASGEWGNAPDFTLRRADGGTVTLSQFKGKVILLNFFFNT